MKRNPPQASQSRTRKNGGGLSVAEAGADAFPKPEATAQASTPAGAFGAPLLLDKRAYSHTLGVSRWLQSGSPRVVQLLWVSSLSRGRAAGADGPGPCDCGRARRGCRLVAVQSRQGEPEFSCLRRLRRPGAALWASVSTRDRRRGDSQSHLRSIVSCRLRYCLDRVSWRPQGAIAQSRASLGIRRVSDPSCAGRGRRAFTRIRLRTSTVPRQGPSFSVLKPLALR